MKAANGRVLVRVDPMQKNEMRLGEAIVRTAHDFGTNYRERSPVVGVFAEETEHFDIGQAAIFHHNFFYLPSPYHLEGDLFGIPYGKNIFGTLDLQGNITPVFGNMLCKAIPVPSDFPLPPDQQTTFINQYEVVNSGWTKFKKGDVIFTRPYSGYEIIYTVDKVERRVVKVDSDMVCGVLRA